MKPPEPAEDREFQARVEAWLARMDTSYAGPKEAAARPGAYHRAAAVLSTFDDELRPVEPVGPDESMEDVLADAALVRTADGRDRYTLLPEVRREVLKSMRAPGLLERARSMNPGGGDAVQIALDRCLERAVPPLESLDVAELSALYEVAGWLEQIVDGVPSQQAVRARLDLEGLLNPFERLVGTHFRGRVDELQHLRDYVGVLEPSSTWTWLGRQVRTVLSLHDKPPLLIYGPGGMGKSTLVAKFILEHARLDEARRFPFVYVDFDRPELTASEPVTVLVEALRQLGLQYPEFQADCETLRRKWLEQLTRARAPNAPPAQSGRAADAAMLRPGERARFVREFGTLAQTLARDGRLSLEGRPILLVLDTFEEVQYRSQAFVEETWRFLDELQRVVPRLRTVLAGRALVAGVATEPLPLLQLDPDAARGFLEGYGLSPSLSRRLASRLGGNPLTLKLTVELLERAARERAPSADRPVADAERELDEADIEGLVNRGEIQRYLYRRILEHIHDDDVRRLAHPGLTLRIVTAQLIREVLAGPCGVVVNTEADAQRLFEEMTREVSLVVPGGPGELKHRPDLRKVMLKFLERDQPERVREIHAGAVAYYARQAAMPAARAEELYHRLALQQAPDVLSERWLPGVEPFLFGAVDELEAAERAWLSVRLQVELDHDARSAAASEVWERDARRRAAEFLATGDAERALRVTQERAPWSAGSELFLVQARAFVALGRNEDAAAALDAGIASAFEAGAEGTRTDLLLEDAELAVRTGALDRASDRLDEAAALIARRGDPIASVRTLVGRLDLDRASARHYVKSAAAPSREELVGALRQEFAGVPDETLSLQRELAWRVASHVPDRAPLVRVLTFAGIPGSDRGRLASLGRALEAWDTELATRDAVSSTDTPLTEVLATGLEGVGTVRSVNRVALVKALAGSFSTQQLGDIAREVLAGAPEELTVISGPDAAAERLVARAEQVNRLPALLNAVYGRRDAVLLPVSRSTGPVATCFDLQLAEEGTLESFMKTAPLTLLPTSLSTALARFEPPSSLLQLLSNLFADAQGPVRPAPAAPSPAVPRVQVTAARERDLSLALARAFPSRSILNDLVERALAQNLESMVAGGQSLEEVVTRIVSWAAREGRLPHLVIAAYEASPGDPDLRRIAAEFDLLTAVDGRVRDLVSAWPADRVAVWHERLASEAARVCRVEIGPGRVATSGFLVAPDVLMTSIDILNAPRAVQVRFDSRSIDGVVVSEGVTHGLADEWLLYDDADQGIVLARLEVRVGLRPLGGGYVSGAPPRGWIQVPEDPPSPTPGTPLLILQAHGDHTVLTGDAQGVIDLPDPQGAVRYRVRTERDSEGSPCFGPDWDLVAVHLETLSGWRNWGLKRGISTKAIVERLRARGRMDLFAGPPPSRGLAAE